MSSVQAIGKVWTGTVLAAGMVVSETVAMASSIATSGAINPMGQAFTFKLTGAGATEPHQSHDSAPLAGGFFLRRPYGALCSGGLLLTTTVLPLSSAACDHVRASSSRSRFSFSVLDWQAQSRASWAYSRN